MTNNSTSENVRRSLSQRSSFRFIGVDIARFLAIAGMIAAHVATTPMFLPGAPETQRVIATFVDNVTHGNAAPLFAVLGGVSIVFTTSATLGRGSTREASVTVAVRGLALITLGIFLGISGDAIIIVLAYYGVAMLLVAPLVRVRSSILTAIAVGLTLGFSWLNVYIRQSLDAPYELQQITWPLLFEDPCAGLRSFVVTGAYPAITWATYLLVGILIGRVLILARIRETVKIVAVSLVGFGIVQFLVARAISQHVIAIHTKMFVLPEGVTPQLFRSVLRQDNGFGAPQPDSPLLHFAALPHSGSPIDIFSRVGLSAVCIGMGVLIFDRNQLNRMKSSPAKRAIERVIDVFRATGAASLSIYTLHALFTNWVSSAHLSSETERITHYALRITPYELMPWWVACSAAFWLQISGALILGAVISLTQKRGPLESLFTLVVARVVHPQSSTLRQIQRTQVKGSKEN